MTVMYTCDECKKAPSTKWGARTWQWKTERGFKNHKCYADVVKKVNEARLKAEQVNAEYERLMSEYLALGLNPVKVGDNVHYVSYRVTAPTHREDQWGRLVRVRYEEERSYSAGRGFVESVRLICGNADIRKAIEDRTPLNLHYHIHGKWVGKVYNTEEEARAAAAETQRSYDNHVRTSESYR